MIPAGARGAWQELETKLRPFVARRVKSATDADDVIQDVFLRMQRGLAGLRDDERFGPWAYQVARSAIADHHRSAARYVLADEGTTESLADESTSDEPGIFERDLSSFVSAFVALLPELYREALVLTELQEMPHKSAADKLGTSLPAMKSRVARGRQMLREAIEQCCHVALDVRGKVLACEPRPNGLAPDGCCGST